MPSDNWHGGQRLRVCRVARRARLITRVRDDRGDRFADEPHGLVREYPARR